VLSLEGKDLVVGVLAEALAVISLLVQFLNFFDSLTDFAGVAFVNALLVAQLFAPHVHLVA
jgi:hypothetical protein